MVDKTHITGVFDVRLDLHVDELFGLTLANMADESDLTAPDPAARFREDLLKLGLRVESFKDTAEFVTDHVERPSEN